MAAANVFGAIDLLILNGDVIDHSGDPSKFANIYEICSRLTGGEIPTIFSRGNHDMRGNYAEKFAEYTPNHLGRTYYTFRLGSIWGILLDCAEDKPDANEEYGYTVCCHPFRLRQTQFLREVIANADKEYAAPGVTTRLVISHHPFTQRLNHPFDIEEDVYCTWAALLRDEVKPDLMICGHVHRLEVRQPGCETDTYGQACPIVIGGKPGKGEFSGCGIVMGDEAFTVTFTNSNGETLDNVTIPR